MDESADWTNTTPPHMLGHVLRPDELGARARYAHAAPDPRLRPWIERYWSVRWQLAEGELFPVATLDDPSVHLTLERGGVARAGTDGDGIWITGPVARGRFDVTLRGSGSVVGVKIRVGAALGLCDPALPPPDLRALRDRTVPAADWFGQDLPGGHRPGGGAGVPDEDEVPGDAVAAAPLLDAWLLRRSPRIVPGQEKLAAILALLEDREVTSMAQLEARSGRSARTLQRLFARHAGIGPKRMLLRARVMDAVAAIDGGHGEDLAGLAAQLGWFDQSHLIRDFRAVIGSTPAAYARRSRAAPPAGATLAP